MKEYEIYFPTAYNDGTPIDPAVIERFKAMLGKVFGGYTHLRQRSEGAWSVGGVMFRDEVTIVRVLDDGHRYFDMATFKHAVEHDLRQQSILIVQRDVSVIS